MASMTKDEAGKVVGVCMEAAGYVGMEPCFCQRWHDAGYQEDCLVCRCRVIMASWGVDITPDHRREIDGRVHVLLSQETAQAVREADDASTIEDAREALWAETRVVLRAPEVKP